MKKTIYRVLFVFFALVFLFSAGMLINYGIQSHENNQLNNSLAGLHTTSPTTWPASTPGSTGATATQPTESTGTTTPQPTESTAPPAPQILPELESLYAINDHLVGWIKIEDTHVDYPVVQTPNTPDWWDYYLHRDFYGNESEPGTLYVRESCDVFGPSDNVTIYGHNQADFSMFGDLWQYGSKKFYEGHRYIQFDTLYEHHTYEIFAVFRTSGTTGVGFAYHLFENATDEADFDSFIGQCKDLQLYETGITPQYGDKLLTLSTCDFHLTNGRLVVIARRIS